MLRCMVRALAMARRGTGDQAASRVITSDPSHTCPAGLSQLAPRVTSDGEGRLTGVEIVAQWRWPAGETRDAPVMLCMVGMVLGVRHNSRKRMGEQLRVGSPRRESGSSMETLRRCSDGGGLALRASTAASRHRSCPRPVG
jgi:hypothetical protein